MTSGAGGGASGGLLDAEREDTTVVLSRERRRQTPQRRKQQRRRLGWIAGGACVALALGGATAWVVYGSPWLRADGVEVQGQQQIDVNSILDAAAVPLGSALASVDTAAVTDRVQALSTIDRATVDLDWPHTVRIQVTPKVIVGSAQNGSGTELIATDGSTVDGRVSDVAALPRIEEGAGDERAMVATALAGLSPASRSAIAAGQAEGGKVRLLLKDDAGVVFWGDTADSARKGAVLDVLLANPPVAPWINVSAPNHPVTLAEIPAGQDYKGRPAAAGSAASAASSADDGTETGGPGTDSGTDSGTSTSSTGGGEISGGFVN